MTPDEYLQIFDAEHEVFIAACEAAGMDAEVPSCPGWKVGDLVYHMYEVQYGWHRLTAERLDSFESIKFPVRPGDDHLISMLRGEHAAFAALLAAFDPESPLWTWTGPQTLGWLQRRMAHEIAVHRVDAQFAGGPATPILAELASDGVDEFLEFFLNDRMGPVAGSVHLHCTDVPGEWMVSDRTGRFEVIREHAKGDCAIRGTASDLLLALWRRRPVTACELIGDDELAQRFVIASALD